MKNKCSAICRGMLNVWACGSPYHCDYDGKLSCLINNTISSSNIALLSTSLTITSMASDCPRETSRTV